LILSEIAVQAWRGDACAARPPRVPSGGRAGAGRPRPDRREAGISALCEGARPA